MSGSDRNGTTPSGGGFGFGGLLKAAARSFVETALSNATTSANSSNTMASSRSFFEMGSNSVDSGSEIVEYSGRNAANEIASLYPIAIRQGDLILHGPVKTTEPSSESYSIFNIILHSTNNSMNSERMFSVFRTASETEAHRIFVIYKQIFPDLIKASTTSLERSNLEKITKLSKQYPSYEAPHIAAALNMIEQLKSPVLQCKLEDQEGSLLHTPMHVAVVHGRLEAFRLISEDERLFNRIYDYVDIKGNNIIHLAAECKDKVVGAAVLKLIREKLQEKNGLQQASSSRLLFQLFQKLNNEGNAPIHLACVKSNKEAVELMVDTIDEVVKLVEPEVDNAMENDNDSVDCKNFGCEYNDLGQREELASVIDISDPGTNSLLNMIAPSTGGTPLHFATLNPSLLSNLLELGSDPNIPDNDGLTPLHKAVLSSNLKSTLLLLSNKAYPNFQATFDVYNNATPLHMAATLCAIDCIKALIVFGADLEIKNGYGQTARHLVSSVFTGSNGTRQDALFVVSAAGAKRCALGISGCGEGCKAGGKNNGKTPENWRISRDGTTVPSGACAPDGCTLVQEAMRGLSIVKESYDQNVEGIAGNTSADRQKSNPVVGGRLLCLDGGGIRGLVLTQMLLFMEKEFVASSGDGSPIISHFDWVAGTSTGGIMALALACGKSVLETQSLYIKIKDKVFTGSKPYNAATMEDVLKREFKERKMSSITKPRVMIMTSLADRRPPDLYIFRNYMSPSFLLGEAEEAAQLPDETYVWETAKVTGAAPTYFTLDNEKFVDGGFIANNPTLDALAELVQFNAVMMSSQHTTGGICNFGAGSGWKVPSVVVSLGTGIPPKVHSAATNLDIAFPTGLLDAIKNVPRLSQLIHLLVDQATQAEGQVVERSRAWCTSIGVPFFRFSPEMSADIELDEKNDEVLVNLMFETWCYMVGNRSVVKELYERLKQADIQKNGQQCQPMEVV